MKYADAPFATLLVAVERMGQEFRRTYYVRRDEPALVAGFLGAYGIATTQGEPWRAC